MAALLGVAACSQAAAPVPVIAPPASVGGRVEEGAWDPRIADAELQWLQQRRQAGDGALHTQRLRLARAADFGAICEHYRQALGEGWERDDPSGPARALRDCGFRQGDARYVLALIEQLPGADFDVLVVAQS